MKLVCLDNHIWGIKEEAQALRCEISKEDAEAAISFLEGVELIKNSGKS
jgi:hypothetical protein